MTSAAAFSGSYSPGGLSGKAKRREAARRAGIASGRRRRQLARGHRIPRHQSRGRALALSYGHRQVTRAEFERRYRQTRPNGRANGLETAWQHYSAVFRCYRGCGQHYRTTNAQRAAALGARGRERCRRQVQRLNDLLEAMGLAVVSPYRNQGAAPGHKDYLVVEIRTPPSLNVTPPTPTGQGERTIPTGYVRSLPATNRNDLIPPPPAADDVGPASPAVTEEEQAVCAQLEFCELKLRMGFGDPERAQAVRADLQGQLRRMRERGDHA